MSERSPEIQAILDLNVALLARFSAQTSALSTVVSVLADDASPEKRKEISAVLAGLSDRQRMMSDKEDDFYGVAADAFSELAETFED